MCAEMTAKNCREVENARNWAHEEARQKNAETRDDNQISEGKTAFLHVAWKVPRSKKLNIYIMRSKINFPK